jgi:hypothetical protein
MFEIEVFWDVTPCSVVVGYQRFRRPFHPRKGGSMDLWNVGILLQHYTASQLRKTRLTYFNAPPGRVVQKFSKDIWKCRSQWPRCLRHVLFSTARILGSCVRIPLHAWICVSAFFCVVLSCVGRGFVSGWSPVQGDLPNVQNRFISFRS